MKQPFGIIILWYSLMCAPKQSEKVIFWLQEGPNTNVPLWMAGSFHESAASKKERKKQVSGGQQAQEYGKAYKMHLLTCENIP